MRSIKSKSPFPKSRVRLLLARRQKPQYGIKGTALQAALRSRRALSSLSTVRPNSVPPQPHPTPETPSGLAARTPEA
ncbi:hypothetical protein GCM10010104_06140 [Streptomyces indiaensis]|uniref:Uncharacterized protein n=1 Tax=Streptomyces indiaensis TaxID=284033 RepID=A0ABN3D4J7_9ACTN